MHNDTHEGRKVKRYTGNNISPAQRARIIEGLCSGMTINQVAKATGAQWLTVRAVQWANSATVEERKRILAERSEHAAADALDLLHSKLLTQGNKIPPASLVPIFGVLVDKSSLLRGDQPPVIHQHQHLHAHISDSTYQQLLASLPTRSSNPSNDSSIQEQKGND